MNTIITYVTYLIPGSFFPEESTVTVESRDPVSALSKAPRASFAFYFYEVVHSIVDFGGEAIDTASGRRNVSGRYYINAQLYIKEQVMALDGDHGTLIGDMERNGWDVLVLCRTGNWQPLTDRDQLLMSTT